MEKKVKKALFQFRDIHIQESKIKRYPKPSKGNIDYDIKPSGIIITKEKTFQLELMVSLKEKGVFSANITAIGLFDFKDVVNKSELKTNFFVNAPAILFPYIRSYLSALTALSGMDAINIPPANIIALGNELEDNTIEK